MQDLNSMHLPKSQGANGVKFRLSPDNVRPGQSNEEIIALCAEWVRRNKRKGGAAKACYVGALWATRPNYRDYSEPGQSAADLQAWESALTLGQRQLLDSVFEARQEKALAEQRADYAAEKLATTGRPVRGYVRDRPDEEKAQRRAAKQKAYRDRLKVKKQAEAAVEVAIVMLLDGLDGSARR